MRTISEAVEDIKSILNNIERTEECTGDTLVDINELVDEILAINCYKDNSKTNADRIRAMSDEELAKLITSGELCAICPFCKYYGTEQCYIENEGVHKNCDSGIMQYLQSEVEE